MAKVGIYPVEFTASIRLTLVTKTLVNIDTFALGLRFDPATTYTVELEEGFVKETGANKFDSPAVSNLSQFTTNSTGPQVQVDEPQDGGTAVTNNTFIRYTYNRQLLAGDGNFYLYRETGSPDEEVAVFNPSDSTANCVISGNQITLDVTGLIRAGETYYTLIDEGAVEDKDGLAAFGFDNDQEHRWTTAPSTGDFPDLSAVLTDAFAPNFYANANFLFALLGSVIATQTASPVKTTNTPIVMNAKFEPAAGFVANFICRSATMNLQGAFSPSMLVGIIVYIEADLSTAVTMTTQGGTIKGTSVTMSAQFSQSAIDGNTARIRFVDASISSVFDLDHQTGLEFLSSTQGVYSSNSVSIPGVANAGDYAILVETGTDLRLTNGFGFLYSTEEITNNQWPALPLKYNSGGFGTNGYPNSAYSTLSSDSYGSAYIDTSENRYKINQYYSTGESYNLVSFKKLTQEDISNGSLSLINNNTIKQLLIFKDQDGMFKHIRPIAHVPDTFGQTQTTLSNEMADSTIIKAPIVYFNINTGSDQTINTTDPSDASTITAGGNLKLRYSIQNRSENAEAVFNHNKKGVVTHCLFGTRGDSEFNEDLDDGKYWAYHRPLIYDGSVIGNYYSTSGNFQIRDYRNDEASGTGAQFSRVISNFGDLTSVNLYNGGYGYKWGDELAITQLHAGISGNQSDYIRALAPITGLKAESNQSLFAIQFVSEEPTVDQIQLTPKASLQCSPD